MATALVLAADLGSFALTYYGRFPREPIKAIGQFVEVPRATRTNDQLATVLGAIAGNAKDKNVLIVTHGTDNALKIKLGSGPAGLGIDKLRDLVYAMDGRISDADMPGRLGFAGAGGAAEWKRLKALISNVWALNLGRVDLRACEIGKNPAVMYFLQRLFNCDVCCAPRAFDVFGSIELEGDRKGPTQDERSWRKWRDDNTGASFLGSGASLFAWKAIVRSSTVEVHAMAASWEAAKNWVARHLPQGNYQSGAIYYHALTPKTPGGDLIFAGDSNYRDYLVEALKGAAEPKVDLNQVLDPRRAP